MGHLSPDPRHSEGPSLKLAFVGTHPVDTSRKRLSKYDFVGRLAIFWIEDMTEVSLSYLRSEKFLSKKEKILKMINTAETSKLSKEDIKLISEARELLEKLPKELVGRIKARNYLGAKARILPGSGGEECIASIRVGRYTLHQSLVSAANMLDPGSTPIHSIKCDKAQRTHLDTCRCPACTTHPSCSTLKKEGFIHKEELERLLKLIISRIKGEKGKPEEEPPVVVERDGKRVDSPADGFDLKPGDKIKTRRAEVLIKDETDNLLAIKENTEIRIGGNALEQVLEQTMGELFMEVEKMKGFDYKIRTPQAVCGVRGTAFALHVGEAFTRLTVAEGEVVFSDLRGRSVVVKSNHFCICTEEGLRKPGPAEMDVKEMFEECIKKWKQGG